MPAHKPYCYPTSANDAGFLKLALVADIHHGMDSPSKQGTTGDAAHLAALQAQPALARDWRPN